MLDRTLAPEAQPVTNFRLKPAQTTQLANGVPLLVVSGGSQPIANLQLVFNAGKWQETQKGLAYFTGLMIGEGTKRLSNHEISQHFERHGVFWSASANADWLEMNFYCLSRQLKNVLPLVIELLTEASFPEEELERLKAKAIQETKVNQEKSNLLASRYLKEQLFGEKHPYGYTLNEQDIEQISTDSLRKFYHEVIQQNGLSVFLAGEVDDSHTREINETIGKLAIGQQSHRVQYDIPATKPVIKHDSREGALQSSLRIGKSLFVRSHEEQIPFSVMNTVLGGYFGSRLMKNIREEKGLTYGIYSSVSFMKNTGFWFISADVIQEKKDLALKEIYLEVERMQTELVSEEELALVQNYMCGSFVKSINSPIPILNCHKAIKLHSLPKDYYDTYISRVRSVTAEEIRKMAQTYLSGPLVEVVVG